LPTSPLYLLRRPLLGGQRIVGISGTFANVATVARSSKFGGVPTKDTEHVLDQHTNPIRFAGVLFVHMLQVRNHVYNLIETRLQDLLLFLEFRRQLGVGRRLENAIGF
jgi:hypothetical protein